ncbi:hypothetical protein [Candidatus Palauibacter sp.]|uniref:hypothetical protein n=1 Tax=Candidatus Palauibacter sp. TaxID=3101350 RepID=UPI003B01EBFC
MTGIRQVVRSRAFLVLAMVPAFAGCWDFVQSLAERDGSYLIAGGRWLDVQTGTLVENDGIGIRDGRIVSIGVPPDTAEFLTEFTLQDDMTILPGLIDLHAHYAVDLFGEGRSMRRPHR